MAATRFEIPPEVMVVLDNFRTAELATIGKDGTPLAWPVIVVYRPEEQQFVTTTAIGLPQKAYNVRRNPKVSMSYTEPRASGLSDSPAVLVQGTARAADELTFYRGIEDVYGKVFRTQRGIDFSGNPIMRRLMDWYYVRIKITVTPTRILWWEHGDFAAQPREVPVAG